MSADRQLGCRIIPGSPPINTYGSDTRQPCSWEPSGNGRPEALPPADRPRVMAGPELYRSLIALASFAASTALLMRKAFWDSALSAPRYSLIRPIM